MILPIFSPFLFKAMTGAALPAPPKAVLEPSRLSEPLLDVEKADPRSDPRHSKGPARSALERRAAERPKAPKVTVETLQRDLKARALVCQMHDFGIDLELVVIFQNLQIQNRKCNWSKVLWWVALKKGPSNGSLLQIFRCRQRHQQPPSLPFQWQHHQDEIRALLPKSPSQAAVKWFEDLRICVHPRWGPNYEDFKDFNYESPQIFRFRKSRNTALGCHMLMLKPSSGLSGGTWTRGEEKNPRGPPKVLPSKCTSTKPQRPESLGERVKSFSKNPVHVSWE